MQPQREDKLFKLRNILNIIFMVGALAGIIIYFCHLHQPGIIVILIGFALMSGGSSTEERFDASIFDTRRIVVAPIVTFVGFASIIYAIILKPKDDTSEDVEE